MSKYCGIIDDNGTKLCIDSKSKCPINFLSENYTENSSSVIIGNKTFYYGYDETQKEKKIIAGLLADTDLYLNKEKNTTDIIDTYNISCFLEDNKNLYKNINLEYDPYEENDKDKKGNSYLRIYYNDISLTNLRNSRDHYLMSKRINSVALNKINKNMKTISILGLIAYGILLIGFIYIIYKQISFFKDGYNAGEKGYYGCLIIIFLALILTPLIFGCINITKINKAEEIDPQANFNTFKKLNIIYIILGFTLFVFLIFYIIFVPVKIKERNITDTKMDSKQNITNTSNNVPEISETISDINKN